MAMRGTPLPIAVRDEVKRLRESDEPASFRAIARELGIDHHTAKKYATQVSPKPLNAARLIA